jgi:hypothetical protein
MADARRKDCAELCDKRSEDAEQGALHDRQLNIFPTARDMDIFVAIPCFITVWTRMCAISNRSGSIHGHIASDYLEIL